MSEIDWENYDEQLWKLFSKQYKAFFKAVFQLDAEIGGQEV